MVVLYVSLHNKCFCVLRLLQSYRSAVATRGLGAHVTGNSGPDPLMSQGSIKASAASQMLAAVNVSLGFCFYTSLLKTLLHAIGRLEHSVLVLDQFQRPNEHPPSRTTRF